MSRTKNLSLLFIASVILFSCAGPKALYTYETASQKVPANVTFINASLEIDSVVWFFGDGNSSKELAPTHRYYLSGNYRVRLEVYKDGKKGVTFKDIYLSAPEDCLVLMKTDLGDMLIELFDATPLHRDNFVKLAEEKYYDSLLFHRVIDGFMIQGGDPKSKGAGHAVPLGSGGPGYKVDAELLDSLVHLKGSLAAARQGDAVNPKKQSSGSQFYIVQGRKYTPAQLQNMSLRNGISYTPEQIKAYEEIGGTPMLDGGYTVYGKVVEGIEVIDSIANVKTNNRDRPLDNVMIRKVMVIK